MNRMRGEFDAVIVGAGPAGCAAAIHLVRAGRRVVVIEKQHLPREKVCGGCVSGLGLDHLRRLLRSHSTLPGSPGRDVTLVIGQHRLTCKSGGATWIVPRAELDMRLAEAAEEAGAVVRTGEAATVDYVEDRWAVSVNAERIDAPFVLLASGVNGLAHRFEPHESSRAATMIAQQWAQPSTAGTPAVGDVELHWLIGGYIGMASPQRDRCVVALAARGPLDQGESALTRLRRLNSGAPIFKVLSEASDHRYHARGTAGFPWNPREVFDHNLLLVGDAAGYAEPFSGEGIGQALRSGEMAARAMLTGRDVGTAYSALMNRTHHRSVARTRFLSRFLQSDLVQLMSRHLPLSVDPYFARLVSLVHVGSHGSPGESLEPSWNPSSPDHQGAFP